MLGTMTSARPYRDRTDAGRRLCASLSHLRGRTGLVVLALPRGGVPVGLPVAADLGCPFDICLVRKLGVPGQPELAAGAIAADSTIVTNDEIIARTHTTSRDLDAVIAKETKELGRRERVYRGGAPMVDVAGRTVVLVDDGVATGATMRAALSTLRRQGAAELIVAVPVGPEGVARDFPEADVVICPMTPQHFRGVGGAYDDFAQLTDEQVCAMLDATRPTTWRRGNRRSD
ncbi:phosphoribosyl transferase [Gordonia polyisoprenivorans VH2]|uniref:Phosphoribosyl transferase n=1 Tax=Gordonia polyisoprenivorans (strain DSM 44266 / VH2) TaxID=1112204 RepID=H6N3N5_GORPV|nr:MULTISPECIES: phosphoribosyltransferase [Gordonia]AFA73506.1 phosphoribosyl transferase [Gordonia polyisoprenivorans VH2]MBE7191467.1 phosphoribosyltransferase [Gordonia polyisoprenivorans]OPX15219.1 phosphoribosyl transferase [Gordonia sp. i37]OZC30608.1 phosphoribosyl transferase [Gordonia polyisoprenivorans]UZF53846.1 phosphoribosyltransferase [Gordonia polyisoprenivorans]